MMAGTIGAAVVRRSAKIANARWPSTSVGGGCLRRACTLVVMDRITSTSTTRESNAATWETPDTTRRVVSAAMQLRVSETGKDSEIHLLIVDPEPVPTQVPVGVTKVLHWKNAGTPKRDLEATESSENVGSEAAVAAEAIEHAFVTRPDATHVLATYGEFGSTALADVARSLNTRLHENVVEIKGRGSFVEHGKGDVNDVTMRRFLTINCSHFVPADLRDAASVPVEVLTPPSRASKLLWKVVPAGMALAVVLCAI